MINETETPRPEHPRVLLVLGQPLGNLVSVTLRHGNWESRITRSEQEARELLSTWRPHLAFVDFDHYPQFLEVAGSGIERGHVPLLAFTRGRDAKTKLELFQRGSDDVIEVPFTLDEVVFRSYALLRRTHSIAPQFISHIRIGELEVDLAEQTMRMRGGPVLELTPMQQSLLYIFAANPGEVLSREMLMSNIWGNAFELKSNVIDRHVRELRVKLGDRWEEPRYIETVPGQGYRYKAGNLSLPPSDDEQRSQPPPANP
jgi:two-component system KDP operon response regulator KdpE